MTRSLISKGQVSDHSNLIQSRVTEKPLPKFARVLHVVDRSSDPYWEMLGGSQALYGVFYQELFVGQSDTLDPYRNFAYCKQDSFKRVPVKNEIVSLTKSINAALTELNGFVVESVYWESVIPVWNSPHLNAYPDTKAYEGDADTGEFFKEQSIYPVQLCPGDVILEGRHGQSIRMGGTYFNEGSSSLSTDKINGKPYTIIRNGQSPVDVEGYFFKDSETDTKYAMSENIDKDTCSIYLTSEQKVPLTQAYDKRLAWKDKKGPDKACDFTSGSQILLNADRIFINGRNKDIELSAKESIGLNATKNISLDADSGKDSYVAFDASKIYLGNTAFQEQEPVLKGQTTTTWLSDLCEQLKTLIDVMSKPAGGDSKVWISSVVGTAAGVKPIVSSLQNTLNMLHSKKVYTE